MVLTHKLHSIKKRPWGWDHKVVVYDGETHIETFSLTYKKVPVDEKILEAAILKRISRIEERLSSPPGPVDVMLTKTEVEALLKEKELLAASESLEDLKTLTELKTVAVTK
jgi:hypothetical protein